MKDLDSSPYRTSGVEQYFLPELPNWANFSMAGSCIKRNPIQYMDFEKLRQSYQLSYAELVELQVQYNERLENYFRSTAVRFLKPVEEASFFSNTLEQVRGGVKTLKLPEVKEVEVIWLEGSTSEELKKLAKNGRFDYKLPLLFSSCHTRHSLAQWVTENELEEVGFYLLSSEALSPFSIEAAPIPGFKVDLKSLFGDNIKYSYFSSLNKQTPEIVFP